MNPVQESPFVNDNIRDFHRLLFRDGSSSSKTIDQIIEDMKTVEAKKLVAAWNALWITDTDKYQGWYTVKEDGVFYTENAREKWEAGNVEFNGTIIMGVNSYEGTLLEMYTRPDGWTTENITVAFYLMRGHVQVNEEQQAAITKMYVDAYTDDLENPQNLTSEDAYLITALICQDLLFIADNFNQTRTFKHPNRNVYTYMIDVYPKIDLLTKRKARYSGLGHAGEGRKKLILIIEYC